MCAKDGPVDASRFGSATAADPWAAAPAVAPATIPETTPAPGEALQGIGAALRDMADGLAQTGNAATTVGLFGDTPGADGAPGFDWGGIAEELGQIARETPPPPAPERPAEPERPPEPSAWDQIPTVTIPATLRALMTEYGSDNVLTGPELAELATTAGNDRLAKAFVDSLRQTTLVKTQMPNGQMRAITIHAGEQASPADVHGALPYVQEDASKSLKVTQYPASLLDTQTTDALIAATKRGVKVDVEIVLHPGEVANEAMVRRLQKAHVSVTFHYYGGGDWNYRTTVPRITVDGHRITPAHARLSP